MLFSLICFRFCYVSVLVFGGWSNTYVAVTCNSHDQSNVGIWDSRGHFKPGINATESREFHISFANNILEISPQGEAPILTYPINCPLEVKYIGIASGFGSAGDWIYCGRGKCICYCKFAQLRMKSFFLNLLTFVRDIVHF